MKSEFVLDTTLLTRDKPLFNGLKGKGFEKIMMFDRFIEQLKQDDEK